MMLGRRVGIGEACENLPEEPNGITLDPETRDSRGIPVLRVRWSPLSDRVGAKRY